MTPNQTFIQGLPKVELHVHIEGTLEPQMLWDFAHKNKVDIPFQSVDAIREAYNFGELQDFLDIYYKGIGVLQTEEDFHDLTWAYLKRAEAQNVQHVEIFYDPQGHTERGIPFDVPLNGIVRALERGKEQLNISSFLIPNFLRHLSEESAFKTFKDILRRKDRIKGVGLDSSEKDIPPSNFARVFGAARKEGFKVVAHAGEEGPPGFVWQALDVLKIDRLDHGNRALEDPLLVHRLVQEGMALTVCPLSNLKLCGVKDMADHPLKRMLELGLRATVNSDYPAYFGGYMNENYATVTEALGLNYFHLIALARNSIAASFLEPSAKNELSYRLDNYRRATLPDTPHWTPDRLQRLRF